MGGKAHLIVGGLVGVGVAQYVGVNMETTIGFVLLGSVVGLVPDLDVNGTMSNRLTRRRQNTSFILRVIGTLIILASLLFETGNERIIGAGAGLLLILSLSSLIKQRIKLFVIGLIVLSVGISLNIIWLMMFGIYISIASRLPHRSLTHSFIGLIYFAVLSYYLEQYMLVEGIMLVCIMSYISHLVLDMRLIPVNRRGVRLLQPFSKLEI